LRLELRGLDAPEVKWISHLWNPDEIAAVDLIGLR
jgi:hypothetical protein